MIMEQYRQTPLFRQPFQPNFATPFAFRPNDVNSGIKTSSIPENNWCVIDMQNLYQGVKKQGLKINWSAFRQYLRMEHNVTKAIGFLGYIREYEYIYKAIRNAGFILEFREVKLLSDGSVDGGNV